MEEQQQQHTIAMTQCSGCGRYFSGITAFDAHHVGQFANQTRRCMTEEEMRAIGLDMERRLVRKMRENKRYTSEEEVWFDVEKREEVRNAFRKIELPPEPQ